jgi:two-component sensor histidine kinase
MSGAEAAVRDGRRVLIVEDDPGVAELERERLEEIGCSCESAATGKAARAAIEDRLPDLMILDYSLPDMRADELLASEGLPPFLIATGKGDEATAVRLMRAGARDYVIKDSSFLEQLPAVVERVLREIETERSLAEARASLEERLRENEALLREIHHRVKNNLQVVSSLIRLQAPRVAGDGTLGLLIDVQSRISAMALIHEILYGSGNLAEVDFLGYVQALSASLADTYGEAEAMPFIDCRGDRAGLPIDKAVPLGLIANELITNALKHAFPASWKGERRVTVSVTRPEKGALVLEVEDNGVGMPGIPAAPPDGGRAPGRESLGLKLVDILGRQLGAAVSLRSADGGAGAVWRVAIGE